MKRRILSFFLVLSLLIGALVRPQRVDAVALTATAVAASAAAILTACGVTYWAASQTDAVDYISGKIDDYLTSIGENEITYDEWLELNAGSNIFDVVSGGVMQFSSGVANKLLDFCRWLQNDEGIESGGEAVGELGVFEKFTGAYVSDESEWNYVVSGNTITINLVDWVMTDTRYPADLRLHFSYYPSGTTTVLFLRGSINVDGWLRVYDSWDDRFIRSRSLPTNGQPSDITTFMGEYHNLELEIDSYQRQPINGSVSITFDGGTLSKDTAIITPSDFVNIPSNIASDASFSLSPSVPLAAGDSVDTATEAILDGITSEDGLSSTVEETPGTAWGWLYTLLVNIAEAITDGVADIKQAVLGLADSIFSKFTTVLQDIKTGINTIVNSITSAVSQLLSAIQALPTTIYSQFTQVLQDIKTGIQGIALDIYTDIINALTYVFVPSQAFIDTYVASLYATFDNHFSILSYPFSILGEFITRASGIGSPEPVFNWGNIYEPFSGNLLISAGSYNLNSALSNQTFAYMYQLYMVIVKGFISFWFLTYLYNWFCDVFKMREADYSPPEVDEI